MQQQAGRAKVVKKPGGNITYQSDKSTLCCCRVVCVHVCNSIVRRSVRPLFLYKRRGRGQSVRASSTTDWWFYSRVFFLLLLLLPFFPYVSLFIIWIDRGPSSSRRRHSPSNIEGNDVILWDSFYKYIRSIFSTIVTIYMGRLAHIVPRISRHTSRQQEGNKPHINIWGQTVRE